MQKSQTERVFAKSIYQPPADHLSAFLDAIDISVSPHIETADHQDSKLLIVLAASGHAAQLIFFTRGAIAFDAAYGAFITATIQFRNMTNPLVNALPEQVALDLVDTPDLYAIANAFVYEIGQTQSGHKAAVLRLGELLVLMILRHVAQNDTVGPGLFAGLAHPALRRSLTAIHNEPARNWKIADLAAIAGMSRSRFMAVFHATVGTPPGAYLTNWRLSIARRVLSQGHRIKSVAAMVGFGSAEALSRAYSRKFGHSPTSEQERINGSRSQSIGTPANHGSRLD